MEIIVGEEYSGRILRELMRQQLHISARLLARLKCDERGILVNGERVTVRHVLKAGDIVTLADSPCESAAKVRPVPLEVEIVYSDEHLTVANKPPHMPTHPSHDHYDDTLANALAYLHRNDARSYIFRPVSRLDRDTSGLVTVAATKYASCLLNRLMQSGGFHKRYIAVTDGVPALPQGSIKTGIRRTAASVIVREICEPGTPGSELALTDYRTLSAVRGHALLEVYPRTGRTHQIRVHLASVLGTPICGDDLYGSRSALIDRQALHAAGLEFTHPITGELLSLFAHLPEDMRTLCENVFPEFPMKG